MLPENLTRTCWDCKQEKPLTLEFFNKTSIARFKYGMAYQCKACKYKDSVEPHRVDKHRHTCREYQKRIRQTPEGRRKINARKMLNWHLKKGNIAKPLSCENCGGNHGRLEAHHYMGYEHQYRLVVRWLCKKCHHG